MSCAGVQAVDIRHWTFGWAMTEGASTMAAAATTPPAVAMNRRRSVILRAFSSCDQLVVRALGDLVPRADQRLELREGRVDLPGHGTPLRLVPDDLDGELLQIA